MRIQHKLTRESRASASVEFALLAVFFLAPLLIGSIDFVIYIGGKAQVNTALQALYYYALTDPTDASMAAKAQLALNAVNTKSIYPVTLKTVTPENACMSSGSLTYIASTASCPATAVQVTAVAYTVQTYVSLPFPIPLGVSNPVLVAASGQTLD